jgi:hypothetical protein
MSGLLRGTWSRSGSERGDPEREGVAPETQRAAGGERLAWATNSGTVVDGVVAVRRGVPVVPGVQARVPVLVAMVVMTPNGPRPVVVVTAGIVVAASEVMAMNRVVVSGGVGMMHAMAMMATMARMPTVTMRGTRVHVACQTQTCHGGRQTHQKLLHGMPLLCKG